jgi:hypothetical protein
MRINKNVPEENAWGLQKNHVALSQLSGGSNREARSLSWAMKDQFCIERAAILSNFISRSIKSKSPL